MKLTTRGRFAVTSMIDLALYGDADGLHQFGAPQLTENLFKIGH